LIPVVTGIFH